EIVRSGVLGDIELMRTLWTARWHQLPDHAPWRRFRDQGGGALLEIGSHHVDLWFHLLGAKAEKVWAESRGIATDDQTVVLGGRMSSGTLVSTCLSNQTAEANEIELFGTQAVLRFSCYRADSLELRPVSAGAGGLHLRLRGVLGRARSFPETLRVGLQGGDYVQSYARQWERFAQALAGAGPVPCTVEEARDALQAVLAAIESITGGAAVAIHPGA
ncbi:MAG: Gfo/Idh/MocA family oxidoreductase, partial [Thermoleophilia bacterium]|nr:Gfo/Idh/MocA family oxidoreductase [Thermoleophilia bacterium]